MALLSLLAVAILKEGTWVGLCWEEVRWVRLEDETLSIRKGIWMES